MPAASGPEPLEPLLRLVSATNLTIAGRRVRVDERVPGAAVLRRALADLGAQEAVDVVDYAFVPDPDVAVVAPHERPAVLVLCGATAAAGTELRPGVVAADRADVVVVPPGNVPHGGSAAARIDWARRFMPVSGTLAAELRDAGLLAGLRVALSLVLEPKTAVLALLLAEAGAEVDVFAFAVETDDDVADELRARGVRVHASAAATREQERAAALALLDAGPDLLIDDGAHVVRLAHEQRPELVGRMIGASEETTSGVTPLRAMAAEGALRLPVIAANEARTKTWFDNRHGTGETCVFAILRVLGRAGLAGVRAAVIGFGPVGEGVAQVLAAVGADVVVVDRDPRRALAAAYAGHRVATAVDAVAGAGLVVSATGVPGTIDLRLLLRCEPDAAIAVAGGVPEEVAIAEALGTGAVLEPLGADLERLRFVHGHSVRLLAGGECVNIVAGEGNPIEIMDLSFGVQLGALRMLVERRGALDPGVHPIDEAADLRVAALAAGLPAPHRDDRRHESVPWRRTRFDSAARS